MICAYIFFVLKSNIDLSQIVTVKLETVYRQRSATAPHPEINSRSFSLFREPLILRLQGLVPVFYKSNFNQFTLQTFIY